MVGFKMFKKKNLFIGYCFFYYVICIRYRLYLIFVICYDYFFFKKFGGNRVLYFIFSIYIYIFLNLFYLKIFLFVL